MNTDNRDGKHAAVIELSSRRWKELTQAYGSAENIPAMLEQWGSSTAPLDSKSKLWTDLWSCLCHQGDVYSGSYAAAPHILLIAVTKSSQELLSAVVLLASIEEARQLGRGPSVPDDVRDGYLSAVQDAHAQSYRLLKDRWNEIHLRYLLGAIAIFLGSTKLGRALFDLDMWEEYVPPQQS